MSIQSRVEWARGPVPSDFRDGAGRIGLGDFQPEARAIPVDVGLEADARPRTAPPVAPRPAPAALKVLIAEDDPVSRRLLQSFLEKWGYEVVVARDGTEAWQTFTADATIGIVISDWMMPGMDGLELTRCIRTCARPSYVYTILLTSVTQKKDVVRGMVAGADDYVTKPFDHEELHVRLRAGERIVRLERKVLEENRALRLAQAALIQSENLASLGQLAAGMAHEINNPLAYVTNNLAVLRRDALAALDVLDTYRAGRDCLAQAEPALAAEVARLEEAIDLPYLRASLPRQLEKSLEGLKRVRDVVNNLRDFARLDGAEFEEADPNAAVATTVEMLRHELGKKAIHLDLQLAELPAVLCHPAKINQVVLNLLLNAIQASPTGGTVTVRSGVEPAAVWVEVEDRGGGIRPEHRDHIFEPFFTTKPIGQGMGLGLSVSYGIVRDHGGSIDVQSEPQSGSTFRVRLPRKAG
ncbi:MAG TPA: response regulator [Isosphaeraceae bacterium]